MNVTKADDGALLLTYDSRIWSRWLLGAAMVLAATAVYDLTRGDRGDDRLVGLAGAAMTLLGVAVVMFETTRFRFDPFRRRIEWERRWAWSRRSGTLAFGDVRHVAVEVPIGDNGVPSRRIVLHLIGGEMIPVTVGYRPDADQQIARGAESVRVMLGHAARPSPDDTIRALVASGRTIDAIKMLVEEERLSLSDAKARVDQLGNVDVRTGPSR
jgi:hypothetical protein